METTDRQVVSTIHPDDIALGAPYGPRPWYTQILPPNLEVCAHPAAESELDAAMAIRKPFLIPDYPSPYLADIVRAFRCLTSCNAYLEVGIFDRGNLAYVANLLPDGAILIGVDVQEDVERDELLRATLKPRQTYVSIIGNSRDTSTVRAVEEALVGRSLDAVFIDGDHTAHGTMADYVNYGSLVCDGGFIMFHDALWEGNGKFKGSTHAIAEIDRFEPMYLIPGYGPCHRYVRPLFRDEIWGTVAVGVQNHWRGAL